MATKRVTIAAGYHGHHHKGVRVEPGDEIEVSESQAEWLAEIGATEAPKPKKRRRKSKPRTADDDAAGELASEDSGDTTTEG